VVRHVRQIDHPKERENVRRIVTLLAAALGALALVAGPALAKGQSPVRFQQHVDGTHTHFVVTPNGCRSIHGPVYSVGGPGPHQASFASSGAAAVFQGGKDMDFVDTSRGPWHDLGPDFPVPQPTC
jgi:hypothetical protein